MKPFSAYGRQLPEGSTWCTAKTSFVSVIGQILFLVIFVILTNLDHLFHLQYCIPSIVILHIIVNIPVLVFTHILLKLVMFHIIPFLFFS